MVKNKVILSIGLIEISIGVITLFVTIGALLFSLNSKSPNVLIFVLITASISTLLGFGILIYSDLAYRLLIYFSSVILLSKILIFADIIRLNGTLETLIPLSSKNIVSIFYHAFVIIYLNIGSIKKQFIKN